MFFIDIIQPALIIQNRGRGIILHKLTHLFFMHLQTVITITIVIVIIVIIILIPVIIILIIMYFLDIVVVIIITHLIIIDQILVNIETNISYIQVIYTT
jgi:hypothetical protein